MPTSKAARERSNAFDAFDMLVLPFPFTDRAAEKRRPAVALTARSVNAATGHTVCAMVTSADNAPWPHDVVIRELGPAGLSAPSLIRLKWFTIDNRLILRRAGALGSKDRRALLQVIRGALNV
jgi:mRNA interferase MazF